MNRRQFIKQCGLYVPASLAIPSIARAFNPAVFEWFNASAPACTKDVSNLVMDQQVDDGDTALTAAAKGQSISYASPWSLYSIRLYFGYVPTGGTVTVRIGTSANLGTYIEEWAAVSVPSAGWVEFVSVLNSAYSASTTYYFGLIENSGDIYVGVDSSSPSYSGGAYVPAGSTWAMGSPDTGIDMTAQVFKCQ